MTTPTENPIPVPAALIRSGVVLISVLVGLSALPGLYFSISRFGGFAFGVFGFELLTIFAAVFGVLIGLGKFRDGFALALACIAGTILLAAVLGIYVDARPKIGDDATLQPWVNRMLLIRLAAVLTLAALASLAVFARDRRCWGAAMSSAFCLVPGALIVGAVMKFGIPFGGGSQGASDPNPAKVISFLAIALIVGLLVSVGGHLLIRAYEFGRPEKTDAEAPKDAKTAS